MLETIRHLTEFSPAEFGDKRIDIIGVGATGSRIAMSLAKLGATNIHLWDFDAVEAHNIPNQMFYQGDIGKLKVEAMKEHILAATEIEVHIHAEPYQGQEPLGDIVFLLTDTMKSRKEIWMQSIKFKLSTKLMIETRMGADNGRIYAVNPMRLEDVRGWEETLYDDSEAEVSACGASISVGPTAELVSGLAVWQFMKWNQRQEGKDVDVEGELIFSLKPAMILSRNFE